MDASITNWLLVQAPVVVVLCIAIYWLAGRYIQSEKDKTDLAQNVVKLTVAYENKLDNDKVKSDEIKKILEEIREEIRNWQK
jgi:hypothetical protein